MSQTTILDTDYATLWFHPQHKIVHHKFHKFIYGQEFRRVMETGLGIFRDNSARKWLSDDRANSALPQADIDWSMQNWIPGMMNSGWKYWALVLPDKAVGQANMKRVVESYSRLGITIQIFEDPDEALQWLETA